ncbi:MAG: methylated-DNA--[protein]-cysteine S-methyltransferase [Bacteroidales bacterium]
MEDAGLQSAHYLSPIGNIEITGSSEGISKLIFTDKDYIQNRIPPSLISIIQQLDEYFKGFREVFTVKLDVAGTDFQKEVWKLLLDIPFGQTTNYMEIAKKMGNPKTIRAVGNANGKNPVSIIVPCHRVIGTNQELTGYAGGLWRKKWLLDHEQKFKQLNLFQD